MKMTIALSEATLVRQKKPTLNVSSVTSDSSAQLDKTLIDYSEAAGTEKILSTG